jgi:hypothetical protein
MHWLYSAVIGLGYKRCWSEVTFTAFYRPWKKVSKEINGCDTNWQSLIPKTQRNVSWTFALNFSAWLMTVVEYEGRRKGG